MRWHGSFTELSTLRSPGEKQIHGPHLLELTLETHRRRMKGDEKNG